MPRTIVLMSGTSLDGVDAAWLETDGETVTAFGPTLTIPYDDQLRRDLRALLEIAPGLAQGDALLRKRRGPADRVSHSGGQSTGTTGRPDRLSWPDHSAPTGSAPDLAGRRCSTSGARDRDRGRIRLPLRRCRGRGRGGRHSLPPSMLHWRMI